VLIGEIGGTDEQEAARYWAERMDTGLVAFIAGKSAPEGKRMGHAGAIIGSEEETTGAKIAAFEDAGVPVAGHPGEVPGLVEKVLSGG